MTVYVQLPPWSYAGTDMLAEATDYEPTAEAFRRSYRMRLAVDVPRETIADEVVEAVQRGRRHVRLPKRAAVFPMLCEAPRRIAEVCSPAYPTESTNYRAHAIWN